MFYDREMARARELQAAEAAKLEELVHHVDLMHATLSKAANDLAAANNNTQAAQQELETRRYASHLVLLAVAMARSCVRAWKHRRCQLWMLSRTDYEKLLCFAAGHVLRQCASSMQRSSSSWRASLTTWTAWKPRCGVVLPGCWSLPPRIGVSTVRSATHATAQGVFGEMPQPLKASVTQQLTYSVTWRMLQPVQQHRVCLQQCQLDAVIRRCHATAAGV